MKNIILLLTTAVFLASCGSSSQYVRNKEARDDARKMAEARALQAVVPHKLMVDIETPPVISEEGADAADDPAIWLNPEIPEQSIIIGTNKKSGLHTYDLNGAELDYVPCGKVNNVDVRSGFPYQDREITIVAASNRTTQGISLFGLNQSGRLTDKLGEIKTNVDDVYGFTLYQNGDKFYAISNGKNGVVEQFLLTENNGKITGEKVTELTVSSQPEGMTTIDGEDKLYIGVEEKFVRVFDLATGNSYVIESSSADNNKFIAYDIEGLANFEYEGKRYLVASIQGSFSYAIFDITTPKNETYITSFSLIDNANGVDGVEETDGLEILAQPMGKDYSEGILVVQDGFNYDGETLKNQNFKIVDLRKVIALVK